MAEEKTIAERVCKIIADLQDKPVTDVTPEKTFDELNADSLDAIEALIALEEEFGFELDDRDINMASKVGDLIAQVEAKANG